MYYPRTVIKDLSKEKRKPSMASPPKFSYHSTTLEETIYWIAMHYLSSFIVIIKNCNNGFKNFFYVLGTMSDFFKNY